MLKHFLTLDRSTVFFLPKEGRKLLYVRVPTNHSDARWGAHRVQLQDGALKADRTLGVRIFGSLGHTHVEEYGQIDQAPPAPGLAALVEEVLK